MMMRSLSLTIELFLVPVTFYHTHSSRQRPRSLHMQPKSRYKTTCWLASTKKEMASMGIEPTTLALLAPRSTN
jgi:hypothetical protein